MALNLTFTISISQDQTQLNFTETTGNTGTGGYTVGGNPASNTVLLTRFIIITPSGNSHIFDKGYTPAQDAAPNGTAVIVPSDIGLTEFEQGVYQVTFEAYNSLTIAPGNLIDSSKVNMLIKEGVISCLQKLQVSRACACELDPEGDIAVINMLVDLNGAILSFAEGSIKCANETINRLGRMCIEFGDCCK